MDLKNLKFDLPAGWREVSRSGNENQLILRVYHVNPLSRVDPKAFQDQTVSSSSNTQTVRIGIQTPSGVGGSFDDFFKMMNAFIASGLAPSYMNSAWLNDMHKKLTQTPGAEVPDESDVATDVTIVKYDNQAVAKEALKSQVSFPISGFAAPIPGAGGKNFADMLENDALKSFVPKEQLERMRSMAKEIKEKMPEMKEAIKKTGLKYEEGTFLGCEAVLSEFPNPIPPPKPAAPAPAKKGTFQGGGSRGNLVTIPLPKIAKPHSKTLTACQAILVNNFVVTGSLLGLASLLPPGETPCYSLNKTEERTDTVAGVKSIYIIPSASNYAQEGYLCREEAEKALRAILSKLS